MLEKITTDDVTAILVKFKIGQIYKDVVVASCYLPYEQSAVTPDLVGVIDYCKNKHLDLITHTTNVGEARTLMGEVTLSLSFWQVQIWTC